MGLARVGSGDRNRLPTCRIPGPRPVHEGVAVRALITPQAGGLPQASDDLQSGPMLTRVFLPLRRHEVQPPTTDLTLGKHGLDLVVPVS